MTGKNIPCSLHHLRDQHGNLITDKEEIANNIAYTFQKNSSSENYSDDFKNIKTNEEKNKLNFKTKKSLFYNKKFSL